MFRDIINIQFQAGTGGNGVARFDKLRKPNGGNGGNGGDVYLEGSEHLYDVSRLKKNKVYKADHGFHGGRNNMYGKDGGDCIVQVPLTTEVYTNDGELLATIKKHGQKVKVAKGGKGGVGNYQYRKGGLQARYNQTDGEEGELISAKLILELQSEVIFIGFPNTGKSSILKEITNADAKVAAYAFTTIDPQIGDLDGLRLMDLPGLIEDTHKGKGLGTRFVKHTKSAKVIAHFISLENDDVVHSYTTMWEELDAIDPSFRKKKEIIVLTKADLVDEKKVKESTKKLLKLNKNIVVTSVFDWDRLEILKNSLKRTVTGSSN